MIDVDNFYFSQCEWYHISSHEAKQNWILFGDCNEDCDVGENMEKPSIHTIITIVIIII